MWVILGSHRRGLLPHRVAGLDNWYLEVDVEGEGDPAELKAGEAIMFSGLTLHRSLLNRSGSPRRSFFVESADAAARYTTASGERRPIICNSHTCIMASEIPWSDERVRVV